MICKWCGVDKEISKFDIYFKKNNIKSVRTTCRTCRNKKNKKLNRDRMTKYYMKMLYDKQNIPVELQEVKRCLLILKRSIKYVVDQGICSTLSNVTSLYLTYEVLTSTAVLM